MKTAIVSGLVFFVWFVGSASAADPAEEDLNFKYQTVTTKEGLTFRVPEDMPVETRNGIVAPIPFDEYMFGKFGQLDRRLKAIDAKLERIEKLLSEKSDKEAVKSENSAGVLRSVSK